MHSVVSFDQGGEWVPLRKPANSKCDATAKDPAKVKRETVINIKLISLDQCALYHDLLFMVFF